MTTRTRTTTWEDPLPSFATSKGMSGREYLQALIDNKLPRPPIAVTLGFMMESVGDGTATFVGTPAEFHYNPIGIVHGGLAMTMLDSALGCAVQSLLPAGVGYTTLETKVNFVRPLTKDTGEVRCIATAVHSGRTVATSEGKLVDASGKLYAHGTTTCLIVRP